MGLHLLLVWNVLPLVLGAVKFFLGGLSLALGCSASGKTLLSGVFPDTDQFGNAMLGSKARRAGNLVCGGWRGGFESWCGDWKERSLSHEFIKRNYQSMRICDQCDAIKPFAATPQELHHLMYTNFKMDAPWTRTLRSHADYIASVPEGQRTPWVEVPGFTIKRVRWDSAHTILLGTGKDLASSVLYDLVVCLIWLIFSTDFFNPEGRNI